MQCILIILTSSRLPSDLLPSSLPTQHCGLNSFKSVKSSLCRPHALGWMTVHWSTVGLQKATPSNKIDFPSLRSYQLPIPLQLGLHTTYFPSLCRDFVWVDGI